MKTSHAAWCVRCGCPINAQSIRNHWRIIYHESLDKANFAKNLRKSSQMKDGRQPAALYHRVQADNSVNWKVVGQVGTNPKQGSRYGELQTIRLAELQAMTPEKWRELRQGMGQIRKLPKLQKHFDEHGIKFASLGVATPEEYQALFHKHIRRRNLEVYTYISTQRGTMYRHWALMGMDNGVIALYNESQQKYWSFLRPLDLDEHLRNMRGWWLKVDDFANKPKVRRW